MKAPDNWLDAILPFPRPEYAKQTEALLTDLLWRSEGSSLATAAGGNPLIEELARLRRGGGGKASAEPDRLIPRRRHGGNSRLFETLPLAEQADTTSLVACGSGVPAPTMAVLASITAPQARGDKSYACVPIHPDAAVLQTLHGLVNKESPANLANAIEVMGWLGGAAAPGEVAALLLDTFARRAGPREGMTGLLDALFPAIAEHVWKTLPAAFGSTAAPWPNWPAPTAQHATSPRATMLAAHPRTPFCWFWRKWSMLCATSGAWHDVLPARRFVDWAMCLLRSALACTYLWEAEFFCRLHAKLGGPPTPGAHASASSQSRPARLTVTRKQP